MLVSKEQITLPGGRVVNAGTITDAARLCVTARSPQGVAVDTFRYYQDRLDAPGPVTIPDPVRAGRTMIVRDDDGDELYDLDAVREWNRARPGSGGRGDLSVVRRTDLRVAVLVEARAGRLVMDASSGRVRTELLEAPVLRDPGRKVRTVVTDLQVRGLLCEAGGDGRVRLSEAGATLLREWQPDG